MEQVAVILLVWGTAFVFLLFLIGLLSVSTKGKTAGGKLAESSFFGIILGGQVLPAMAGFDDPTLFQTVLFGVAFWMFIFLALYALDAWA